MNNKKRVFLFFLLLMSCCVGNSFAERLVLWNGYAGGRDIEGTYVFGVDAVFFNVGKNLDLGCRVFSLNAKRKNYTAGNGKCSYFPILFGGTYNVEISKIFTFNTKIFVGLGCYEREGKVEEQEKEVTYVVTCSDEWNLSVGMKYALKKTIGIGLELGYRGCRDLNYKTDDKFNLSGFMGTVNLIFKI
ncbi:MAG: hypothetical protein LBI80_04440 [Endomicrobium sp.]|nr:hypothetical protein [Endomicrobium sp.]